MTEIFHYLGFATTVALWVGFWIASNTDFDPSKMPHPSDMWRSHMTLLTLIGIAFVCLMYRSPQ